MATALFRPTSDRSNSVAAPHECPKTPTHHKVMLIFAVFGFAAVSLMLFQALASPSLAYRIAKAPADDLASPQFLRTLEVLTNSQIRTKTHVQLLPNGEAFYPAEVAAIRSAQQSVNLEAYIFEPGVAASQYLDALTDRAQHGVRVNLVIDAVGSFSTKDDYFKGLRAAGGRVEWYHPVKWYDWPRANNRTHRELLVVDGSVGFVGGAGIADHWLTGKDGKPRWRDEMFRIEGDAVTGLQSTFAENWLESTGEILTGVRFFPFHSADPSHPALVVQSAPSVGGSTHARVLFQTLLASAKHSLVITTPYFLPDESVRAELIRAIKERHVDIRIITPGQGSDHLVTRRSSRRLYGDLLAAGAHIYEYQPSMIHAKAMVIDGQWSVVGSTNFDSRSFLLNDEVNLASYDPELSAQLTQLFWQDVGKSHEVSYEEWKHRPKWERFHEWLGAVIEQQQ